MAKTQMAREQLQSLVDRLAQAGLSLPERSALYREAKAAGFDREALTGVVRFAKMDRADAKEAWAILDLYMTYTVLD